MQGRRGWHRAQRCCVPTACVAALTVVLSVAGAAFAAEPPEGAEIELAWPAVESCPTAERVRAEIDRLLAPSGGGPPGRSVSARAHVVAAREGEPNWLLRMDTVVDAVAGERVLVASSCEDLAAAAALIVALAVDPAAVERAQASGPTVSPEDPSSEQARTEGRPGRPWNPPGAAGGSGGTAGGLDRALPGGRTTGSDPASGARAVAQPPSAAGLLPPRTAAGRGAPSPPVGARLGLTGGAGPTEPPAGAESEVVRGFAGVQATVDVGSLPAAAFGVGAVAGLRVWRVRVAVDGSYFVPQSSAVEGRDAGGDFELFEVGLGVCGILLDEPLELGPCVGAELGRMAAAGYGVTTPSESEVLWAAVRAGALAAYRPTEWLALRFEGGMAVPMTRPHWLLVGVGEVDRPSAVAARFVLGAEARF